MPIRVLWLYRLIYRFPLLFNIFFFSFVFVASNKLFIYELYCVFLFLINFEINLSKRGWIQMLFAKCLCHDSIELFFLGLLFPDYERTTYQLEATVFFLFPNSCTLMPILLIFKSLNKKLNLIKKLPLYYTNSKYAWMTSEIFYDFVSKFNKFNIFAYFFTAKYIYFF